MKKLKLLIKELTPFLVACGLASALATSLTGCTNKYYGGVPCEILLCTDYSSGDDAYLNGVMNEICGLGCEE